MKKKCKQLIAAGLSLMLAAGLSLMLINPMLGFAEEEDRNTEKTSINETESNNTMEESNEISANTKVNGITENEDDVDWYHLVLEEDGYIWLDFGHDTDLGDYANWAIEVYYADINGEFNEDTCYGFNLGGHILDYSGQKQGVLKGDCYVKICRINFSDDPYWFKLNYVEADDWEYEYNQPVEQAMDIELNKTMHGTFFGRSDEEYCRFVIEEEGYVWVDADYLAERDDFYEYYWTIQICDEDMNVLLEKIFDVDENNETTTEKLNLSPGTYYLVMKDTSAYFPDVYTYRVNFSSKYQLTEVVMYRLYNPNSGEHFYTANAAERDHLKSLGWKDEGTGWTAPETSDRPVYRVYNPNAGDHHYTMNKAEKDHLVSIGWNDEGIGWYSADDSGAPLYRQYNPNAKAGAHNYTTNAAERDHLVSLGWNDEGIGWYGLK